MSVEKLVDEIAANVHREVVCRKALKEIATYVWEATDGDRNPNKGDLYKIARIAQDALKETEVE